MISRILTTLFAAIVAIFLVTLALSNRHNVNLVLDPFNRQAPAAEVVLPFFYFLLGALILGVFIGGMSTWFSQGKWRKTARQRTQEAMRWKGEAERLTRERDSHVAAAKQLAASTPKANHQSGRTLAIAGR